ncbi:heavy metal translocating P-type ATPase [Phenylobacterium sp. CCH12-B4]|uniref:heavy metal translocating P-type ATPase n=1 Tax=Phenylobacterium sp. CCH12-B4 TaxID=1768784 RepID=UPI000B1C91B9|nr:heavy metal translocating P-type ATPase [Phenylobacterium sp. CCH12-B4]
MALTYEAARTDLGAFLSRREDGRSSLDLLVPDARCAGCMAKIEREMQALPGVAAARLNLTQKRLTVEFRAGAGDAGGVVDTLARLGYPATPYDPGQAREAHDREGRQLILAMAVAGFGVMNTMMFSVPIWAGLFGQELGPATRVLMMWFSGIVGAPCALYAGMPFFRSAWRSLKARRANMDVPISIGVILTLAISFSETVLGGRDAYFDAAVSLLFLLLIGRWLEHRLRARASSAAADLLALQAPTATLIGAGDVLTATPVDKVQPGDLLLVRPGDRLPVDGEIVSGASELDNSLLTGETAPVAVARLVEMGAQSKSKYVRLADKAAAIYVPVVHTVALLTFAGGWALGLGPREALIRAVAVLIVTCPCALGLAVPAVQITASARLFRRGVLVKSGAALERLADVDHVIFDKTGVLTLGRPRLRDTAAAAIAMAAPLARASRHPLAHALAEAAGDGPLAEDVTEHPGEGVEGVVDGRRCRLGKAAFLGVQSHAAETELWFGFDNDIRIRFAFVDPMRADVAQTVAALRARGLSAEILSGDLPGPVERAAAAAGVARWRAGCTPADKAAIVDELTRQGRKVLMVGDGLNDAGALAKAHAAMAPGTALEASQNAADLVFSGESLMTVVDAVDVARSARARAMENFGLAALYNLIAAPAAMVGLVNPFVAAIAMSGSSLVVTLNALRTGARR